MVDNDKLSTIIVLCDYRKFILGVTRMFCDGELRTANDIGNLNSTLKLVASDAQRHHGPTDRRNGRRCRHPLCHY